MYLTAVTSPCTVEFDSNSPQFLSPTYHALSLAGYQGALMVASQLTSFADEDLLKTETSTIQIQGAEVLLTTADKATVLAEYSTVVTTTITPERNNPGYGGVVVDLIPAGLELDTSISEVLSRVRVFGKTLGNTKVESNYFEQPIAVDHLPDDACTASEVFSRIEAFELDFVCFPGQDQTPGCYDETTSP
ncbi:MAG: hypothetical protein MK135_00075 [Polyangiaceae bacterium]|nr:hypothetical protein [Polyangiaceae bacterium]